MAYRLSKSGFCRVKVGSDLTDHINMVLHMLYEEIFFWCLTACAFCSLDMSTTVKGKKVGKLESAGTIFGMKGDGV